jgi:tRNA nucleotidyltransferase (CCA-adding enzyme)
MIEVPARVIEIARAVRESGGRALIVGGWVRDRIMKLPGKAEPNIDLEVFHIDADRLRALLERFGRVEAVGQSFQVYKLGAIDISLPRRDSKAGRGHRGFVVVGDPDMSIEEAARRRDFTVNAISWDPLSDEYFDPVRRPRRHRTPPLRMVDAQTFPDDSLRVLRAIQFVARLGFALDEATRDVCRGIALDDLPSERVWGEFEKLLFADTPSMGFALAMDLGVVAKLFPELQALAAVRRSMSGIRKATCGCTRCK